MIAETSIDAYRSIVSGGYTTSRATELLNIFRNSDPGQTYTRQQLSQMSGMPINIVCGRINELLEKKYLEVIGTTRCPTTNKRQQLLRLHLGA